MLAVPLTPLMLHGAIMSIADVIKSAMKRKNLKQDQLAELVGVQQPTVQRWCSGKREPDFEMLPKLAKALDLEPYDFLDLGLMRSLGLAPVDGTSPEGAKIVGIFASLDPQQRGLLVDMASMIRNRGSGTDG